MVRREGGATVLAKNMLQQHIADKHQGERIRTGRIGCQVAKLPKESSRRQDGADRARRVWSGPLIGGFWPMKAAIKSWPDQPVGNLGGNMAFTNHTYSYTRSIVCRRRHKKTQKRKRVQQQQKSKSKNSTDRNFNWRYMQL